MACFYLSMDVDEDLNSATSQILHQIVQFSTRQNVPLPSCHVSSTRGIVFKMPTVLKGDVVKKEFRINVRGGKLKAGLEKSSKYEAITKSFRRPRDFNQYCARKAFDELIHTLMMYYGLHYDFNRQKYLYW